MLTSLPAGGAGCPGSRLKVVQGGLAATNRLADRAGGGTDAHFLPKGVTGAV